MPSLNLNTGVAKAKGSFKPADALDADTYMCRVVSVITVGLQEQRAFKGEPKPPKDEVQITYEFCTEFLNKDDGSPDETKPRWLSEFLPINSLDSDLAKLTKRYKAIDSKGECGGDLFQLVGKPCMVTIVKNPGKDGIERNYIAGVSPAPKGIPFPALVNEARVFHVDDPDLEVYNSLPDWLKEKISGNLRFKGSKLDALLSGGAPVKQTQAPVEPELDDPFEDDIPF